MCGFVIYVVRINNIRRSTTELKNKVIEPHLMLVELHKIKHGIYEVQLTLSEVSHIFNGRV